ncbi:MAG: ROK family protein [Geobacter sp.]|nr:ROK family protein [Geobacter sp.]
MNFSDGYIGIDIGGTNLRGALLLADGSIASRFRQKTDISSGVASFLDRLTSELVQVMGDAAAAGVQVKGIGLGVPGLIGRDGLIHSSVNLQPLEELNLAGLMMERLSVPVVAANDANLNALGESLAGAGRGLDSLVVITIGTGLGSGLLLDGRLWSGTGGFAAEFGHTTVVPDGLPCPCGNRGCLEQYVSAAALSRHGGGLTPEVLAVRAAQGEPQASAAFEMLGYWLGTALAGLLNTLNLQGVVIGGGVAESFRLFEPSLRRTIEQRTFRQISQGVVIRQAMLGDDAGLVGAARYAAQVSG